MSFEPVDPRALPPTKGEEHLKRWLLWLPLAAALALIGAYASGLVSYFTQWVPFTSLTIISTSNWSGAALPMIGWIALTLVASGWHTVLRLRRVAFGLDFGVRVACWTLILTAAQVSALFAILMVMALLRVRIPC